MKYICNQYKKCGSGCRYNKPYNYSEILKLEWRCDEYQVDVYDIPITDFQYQIWLKGKSK
jgi:hypothetical protein